MRIAEEKGENNPSPERMIMMAMRNYSPTDSPPFAGLAIMLPSLVLFPTYYLGPKWQLRRFGPHCNPKAKN
jgi:hypothetical protein